MNWVPALPELYYTAVAGIFFVFTMSRRAHPGPGHAAALTLSALGIAVALASTGVEGTLFMGAYRVDPFSQWSKVLIAAGLFLVVWLSPEPSIPPSQRPEFWFLLTTCTLGMIILVSSVELLTLYVALELTSYSLYVMVPLRGPRSEVPGPKSLEGRTGNGETGKRGTGEEQRSGEERAIEAGIKYFLIGAITASVMLFGLACLYGAARTTYLSELYEVLPALMNTPLGFVGVFFTLAGFFFKLAFFPFHLWGPTVYEAASNEVTAFIGTITKAVAIAVITRVVASTGGSERLADLLLVLCVASMTLGNLAALVQRDIKRLLAYSAVSHAGYALIGILSMSPKGYAAALFYAASYMVMTLICFLVVIRVSNDGRNLLLADLAGLHRRSPLLAMTLMVGVFSLGGIPPTIGFTGKFLVLTAAMEKGHLVLVLIAMANVALSLYYYIQIIRAAYLLEPEGELPGISLSPFGKVLTLALTVCVFLGGVFPGHLYGIAARAAGVLP